MDTAVTFFAVAFRLKGVPNNWCEMEAFSLSLRFPIGVIILYQQHKPIFFSASKLKAISSSSIDKHENR